MRSATIGPPTDEAQRLAEGCLPALENMHAVMRPGVTLDEVAQASAHWGGDYGYRVGAGLPPHWGDYTCRIRTGSAMGLQAGMVFRPR